MKSATLLRFCRVATYEEQIVYIVHVHIIYMYYNYKQIKSFCAICNTFIVNVKYMYKNIESEKIDE